MTKLSKNQLELLRLLIGMHLDGVELTKKNTGLPIDNGLHTVFKTLTDKGYLSINPRKDLRHKITYSLTFSKCTNQ